MVVGAGHLEPRNLLYFQVPSFTSAVKSSVTLIRPQAISSLYLETCLQCSRSKLPILSTFRRMKLNIPAHV